MSFCNFASLLGGACGASCENPGKLSEFSVFLAWPAVLDNYSHSVGSQCQRSKYFTKAWSIMSYLHIQTTQAFDWFGAWACVRIGVIELMLKPLS